MTKMTQRVITYILETKRIKIQKPQNIKIYKRYNKKRKDIKDHQIGISELKNTIAKIKDLMDKCNSRIEGTKQRLTELESNNKNYQIWTTKRK